MNVSQGVFFNQLDIFLINFQHFSGLTGPKKNFRIVEKAFSLE